VSQRRSHRTSDVVLKFKQVVRICRPLHTRKVTERFDNQSRNMSPDPLQTIRAIVDEALEVQSPDFEVMYSAISRPSIPPDKLLRALLLRAFYDLL